MNFDFFDGFNSQVAEGIVKDHGRPPVLGAVPEDEFVLCHDAAGKPTAVYGDDVWDFNPLRLSAKKISNLRFDCFLDNDDRVAQRSLIAQSKYIVFCLIYYVGSGRLGRLSAATVYNLFSIVRTMSLYCYAQRSRELVGVLTMEQLLSTPVYLTDFIKVNQLGDARLKFLRQLICNLQAIGETHLGFRVVSLRGLKASGAEAHQHPVIPTRIYLETLNSLSDSIEKIYPYAARLEAFLEEFSDRFYGLTHYVQKSYGAKIPDRRLTMPEAIEAHELGGLLKGEYACSHRRGIMPVIYKIQYVVKYIIHAYTGMRDQEVMRLPYSCIGSVEVSPASVDVEGLVHERARMIDVISTTTKFTGHKSEASWLATYEVVKAVEVARHICRGLSKVIGKPAEDLPLMLNPSVINYSNREVSVSNLVSTYQSISLGDMIIDSADLKELLETTTKQGGAEKFVVGRPWNFTSHQLRLSLAFYGSNSGFISLPSLKRQFKQISLEMARYYANNFEKMKTIFGYYDSSKDEFVIPPAHVALEFQMAMPISVAYDLLSQVFEDPSALIGGAGSYIQKQRERLVADGVLVAEVRADTERRVRDGQLSYRRTLLGGCTKVGECDEFMLGDFVSCLTCSASVIKPSYVEQAIEMTITELEKYDIGTGEYQVTKQDLDSLTAFANRRIYAAEVV